jgi:hypothetical protein
VEDHHEDRNKIVSGLQAIGGQPERIRSAGLLPDIASDRSMARPDLIIVDAHWKLQVDTLEAVTGSRDKVEPSDVGLLLGRYLRGFEHLRRATLVLTSTLEEPLAKGTGSLERAVTVHKKRLFDLRAKSGQSATQALAEIGIPLFEPPPRHAEMKLLKFIANSLGLGEEVIPALAGAFPFDDVDAENLVTVSRDAEDRIATLENIVLLLRQKYGKSLPTLEAISKDIGFSLERIIVKGSLLDLLRVQWDLEARAGGRVD